MSNNAEIGRLTNVINAIKCTRNTHKTREGHHMYCELVARRDFLISGYKPRIRKPYGFAYEGWTLPKGRH